jgi:hypothetical protein
LGSRRQSRPLAAWGKLRLDSLAGCRVGQVQTAIDSLVSQPVQRPLCPFQLAWPKLRRKQSSFCFGLSTHTPAPITERIIDSAGAHGAGPDDCCGVPTDLWPMWVWSLVLRLPFQADRTLGGIFPVQELRACKTILDPVRSSAIVPGSGDGTRTNDIPQLRK